MPLIDCSNPQEFDCANKDCQQWCVGRHEIAVGEFIRMVNNYFYYPTTFPTPYVRSLQEIKDVIEAEQCGVWLNFDFDELTNHKDNAGISISVTQAAKTTYSFPLFLGLLNKFSDATEYHFFKAYAINRNTQKIIPCTVFRIMKNTDILYYGDLSGLRP